MRGTYGLALAGLVALVGFGRGIRFAIKGPPLGKASTILFVCSLLGNLFVAGVGALLAMLSTLQFQRGRQLRRFGRVLLARIEEGPTWASVTSTASVEGMARAIEDERARAGLAAQWRENGRTEHASVAAFARLTLDLMALGAPPSLIAASNRDALDEVRHTELCFSLARALDGRAEGPGPFPEAQRARTLVGIRGMALIQLAVDSLIDGALHEGVSARIIAKLAKRCEVPEIRAILKEIAADEGRHAAHGWDVVEWCVAQGGTPVLNALRAALTSLPATMESPLPEAAVRGAWERYGIHGHALEQHEYTKARAEILRRLQAISPLAQDRGAAVSKASLVRRIVGAA
ncbi:ferritin-like domain-containing protein [Pendulispora brunnea]|uniref:Ferritin-like domain-containing protein n=1 Tax=Pendulispora brunnea TaxID=2905690 RepID=A0ABZ2KF85_9BACT